MVFKEVYYSGVEVAFLTLGVSYIIVVTDGVCIGKGANEREEVFLWLFQEFKEDIGYHYGSGIDKRIARLAMLRLKLHKGVEGCSRGLSAHTLPDIVATES